MRQKRLARLVHHNDHLDLLRVEQAMLLVAASSVRRFAREARRPLLRWLGPAATLRRDRWPRGRLTLPELCSMAH